MYKHKALLVIHTHPDIVLPVTVSLTCLPWAVSKHYVVVLGWCAQSVFA